MSGKNSDLSVVREEYEIFLSKFQSFLMDWEKLNFSEHFIDLDKILLFVHINNTNIRKYFDENPSINEELPFKFTKDFVNSYIKNTETFFGKLSTFSKTLQKHNENDIFRHCLRVSSKLHKANMIQYDYIVSILKEKEQLLEAFGKRTQQYKSEKNISEKLKQENSLLLKDLSPLKEKTKSQETQIEELKGTLDEKTDEIAFLETKIRNLQKEIRTSPLYYDYYKYQQSNSKDGGKKSECEIDIVQSREIIEKEAQLFDQKQEKKLGKELQKTKENLQSIQCQLNHLRQIRYLSELEREITPNGFSYVIYWFSSFFFRKKDCRNFFCFYFFIIHFLLFFVIYSLSSNVERFNEHHCLSIRMNSTTINNIETIQNDNISISNNTSNILNMYDDNNDISQSIVDSINYVIQSILMTSTEYYENK